MKKALLTYLFIVSSCFFVYAQVDLGGVKVNVGKVCGTYQGKPACINPTTGQWEYSNGNGGGASGNLNTGQFGGSGTIGGVRFGVGVNGTGAAGTQFAGGLLGLAQTVVARLVPLLIGVAMLAFFWFLVEYIWKGKDDPEEYKKGRAGMFYSVLAIFVMVSIWGIVGLLGSIFGISQGGNIHGFIPPGK